MATPTDVPTPTVTVAVRLAAPVAVALGAAVAGTGIWFAKPTTPGGPIPVCPSKALLGLNCPGCGSCRMIYSLLHGDLPAALHFNALGAIALVVLLIGYATWAISRVRGTPHRSWTTYRHAPTAVLVTTLAWFVVRNLPFAPFTGLRV